MKKSAGKNSKPAVPTRRRHFLVGTTAAAAFGLLSTQVGAQNSRRHLRVLSWPGYTGTSVREGFTAQTGITVSVDFYESSDEMLGKVKASDSSYDVVISSYDYIEEMIGRGLLQQLDHNLLENRRNLFPVFNDARFDPGRRFTMPFLWGTQGICFRKSAMKSTPDSWQLLVDSAQHSGRIAIPGPDTLGLALKYLGFSYNSVDPRELEAAGALLIRQKPHVKEFVGPDGIELLSRGDVDLAVSWNTEVKELMEKDDNIGYRVPNEGGLLWQDCLCVPHTSANVMDAHKLINYVLDGNVAATIAGTLKYATPNRAAAERLGKDYREDPTIFPGMEIIKRCEPALNLGKAGTELRDRVWKKVIEA
jgi:spermidine/putrescine transport system substrate-binding protein